MRLLHVGSGFRPWRRGGLVAYVEDLMEAQVARGHQVSYFFSGRQYPLARAPRMRRWRRGQIDMYEVINSPLFDHGRQPALELDEPQVEALFGRLLADLRPDVVHFQELAGLPSSLLDMARRSGAPTLFTLQDYFPLCSTFKLLDAEQRVCLRREIGADCALTVAADPRPPGLLVDATTGYELMRTPLLRPVPAKRRPALVRGAGRVVGRLEADRRGAPGPEAPALYQRRRQVNLERLNQTDRLIAMSKRVAEIYHLLGVETDRLQTLQLTLAHIETLRPRSPRGRTPVTFASLAALESAAKGGRLLIEAVRRLAQRVPDTPFRVLIFGHVDPALALEAANVEPIEIRSGFAPAELNAILDEVDVGILPSIWEEAYGYAGVEFLAKGIPVIANDRGGMPEYTRPGKTGWLNHSSSAGELAEIMAGVVCDPDQIKRLSDWITSHRQLLIKPMSRHAQEIDEIYRAVGAPGA